MGTRAEDVDALMETLARAVETLPAATIAALADDPRIVSVALATAAGVVGESRHGAHAKTRSKRPPPAGSPADHVDEAEARERLARRTRSVVVADTMSSDEVAGLLGLKGRASVLQRLRDKRLIGIEGERRGVRFPRRQFDSDGQVRAGVPDVRALFPDGFSTWLWLSTGSSSFDGDTPLSRLEAGQVDAVVAAATGERQGDFW